MERRYVTSLPTKLAHYTAGAFSVTCFDARFHAVFAETLDALGVSIDALDLASVAGGGKIFATPEVESDRDFMRRELEKSVRLHRTDRVLLFTHHDCGAYGGFSRFGDPDRELEFHRAEHERAKEYLATHFPALSVETFFLDPHGALRIL